ncbi:unnamed protein product [Allacma fusca]|uniref:Uncharacterized protein n=1 Tax=Allacma fusca TaxID=39272 RepID=A0A8J2KAV4_9HEXA|nr:unnamed protein product [Allacma fusca]
MPPPPPSSHPLITVEEAQKDRTYERITGQMRLEEITVDYKFQDCWGVETGERASRLGASLLTGPGFRNGMNCEEMRMDDWSVNE